MNQTQTSPRRERRGIILVFVVVLLVLLAIMGTAYLATTRADLVTIRGRGAGPNANTPLLVDRSLLDDTYEAVSERLKMMVGVEDLLGADLTAATANADAQRTYFRQGTLYENFDAPGTSDVWLSSLMPTAPGGADYQWPWTGAAVEVDAGAIRFPNFFADPRFFDGTPASGVPQTDRSDTLIGWVDLAASANVKTSRRYPALQKAGGGGTVAIAGDADGDGIADSYLIPIRINPTAAGINQYLDPQNGVIYYYAYRVVDNSAQLNLGTALSVSADFPINMLGDGNPNNNDTDTAGETRLLMATNTRVAGDPANPNYGFFRSNVGLIELVREALAIYTGQTAPNTPGEKELRRLIDYRFANLKDDPAGTPNFYQMRLQAGTTNQIVGGIGALVGNPGATEIFQFRSFGDMLEHQALKRPGRPLGWFYTTATGEALGSVTLPGASELASLHDKGNALINPEISPGALENALLLSVRDSTPNFQSRRDAVWKWFPPDQVALWYHWTKNLDGLARDPSDTEYSENHFTFNPGAAPFNTTQGLNGMTTVELQRSLRAVLTVRNGEMTATPYRSGPGAAVPEGMPAYGTSTLPAALNNGIYGTYPAIKVSAATGTKRQLWRAYWSVMTLQSNTDWLADSSSVLSTFLSTNRYPNGGASDTLSPRNMALIRSAIAAVNTIDLRDVDDDISELDVKLEEEAAYPGVELVTRVFGTERRPYITEVMWADENGDAPGGAFVGVEIYNPHAEPIDISDYHIGIVNRTGNGLAAGTRDVVAQWRIGDLTVSGTGDFVIPGGSYAIIMSAAVCPIGTTPNTAVNPETHVVLVNVDPAFAGSSPGNELVLARYRRADGVPAVDPTGQYTELPSATAGSLLTMVPLETIDMRYIAAPSGTDPVEWQYRRTAVGLAATADLKWRCVYGGQMFNVINTSVADQELSRPQDLMIRTPGTSPAWKDFKNANIALLPDHTLGVHETTAPSQDPAVTDPPEPFVAPAIQIHNFAPLAAAHPDEKFPFGSPFARDGDVVNVPFVGAHTLLRRTGATSFDVVEVTALPTDAWLAEPDAVAAKMKTGVGRFDATSNVSEWASDLFTFVTARQAPGHDFFPDVPTATDATANTFDTVPATPAGTERVAYLGNDGPVKGTEGTVNAAPVRKIRYSTTGAFTRDAAELAPNATTDEAFTLVQGKMNLNTAPEVVLRMLPWSVDVTNGTVTGTPVLNRKSTIADQIETRRTTTPFQSIFDLTVGAPAMLTGGPALGDQTQLIYAGDLSGSTNKPDMDIQNQWVNLTRVSNFVTQRSDVYTVYFSVQAWTYKPGGGWTQANDTRLVAERRGAFVLDRSQVNPVNGLSTDALLIFPITTE